MKKTLLTRKHFAPAPKRSKPAPTIDVVAHYGDRNIATYVLPFKQFRTLAEVRKEVKRRNKNVEKAFITFPGDEFAESTTFTPKLAPQRAVFDAVGAANRLYAAQHHAQLQTA
jgi:hypothetical protein